MVVVASLLLASVLSSPLPAPLAADIPDALAVWTVDGGGGLSVGDAYSLHGTVGQPDALTSSGGAYALLGGFWPAKGEPSLFRDGFESGDTTAWTSTTR